MAAMKKFPGLFLLALLSVALIGCALARTYRVQVNGYTEEAAVAPFAVGVSFFVVENQEAANPLLEKEVKVKLDKLLEKHGYFLAPYEQAEYCLLFTYGMGAPQTVAVAEPSWGIGVGFGTGYWGPGAGYGFYWPGCGPYPYYVETQAFYDRWLRLTVVEGKQYRATGKKAQALWVGEARSSGTSSDLREVLNPLLLAAFEQFGKNTRKAVPTTIKQNDSRLMELEKVQ
jgi:hypothetical protein